MIELDRGWQPLALFFCGSESDLIEFEKGRPKVQRGGWQDVSACFYHYPASKGRPEVGVIACRDHKDHSPIQIAGLLAHECQHAVQRVTTSMGDTAPSEEFRCYALQAILMSVMDAYEQRHGKTWGLK